MGGGAEQNRAACRCLAEAGQCRAVRGRGRHVEFQVARHDHPWRPQGFEPGPSSRGLGEAQIHPRQQRLRSLGRRFPPSLERCDSRPLTSTTEVPRRSNSVHQVRPELGLRQQRQIRPPMVEEAADEGGASSGTN